MAFGATMLSMTRYRSPRAGAYGMRPQGQHPARKARDFLDKRHQAHTTGARRRNLARSWPQIRDGDPIQIKAREIFP
jgi:hypothetical protein